VIFNRKEDHGCCSYIQITFAMIQPWAEQWLAPLPHRKRTPGSNPAWGLSEWGLHVISMHVWVLSSVLPSSKNMHVRLIGD